MSDAAGTQPRSTPEGPLSGMRAIVAGGGVAGPAAAVLLARAGAQVVVIERLADYTGGGGYVLAANGLAVLYGLGLRDALQAKGRQVHDTYTDLEDGRMLAEHRLRDYGDGLDHSLGTPRFALCSVLLRAMEAEPRIDLRMGCTVLSASRDGRLTYADADGAHHELTADLVVGADGVRSAVRASGRFGARFERMNLAVARVLAVSEPGDEGPELYGERWTQLGTVIRGGSVQGRTYMSLACASRPARKAIADRDLGAIARLWGSVLPTAAAAIAELDSFDDLLVNRIDRVRCRTWVDGRLVLIGDAAHAMPPHVGQGANSSLLDAAVLVQELIDAAERDATLAAGLAAYETRRRPQANRVQRLSSRTAFLADRMVAPGIRQARNLFMRIARHLPNGGLAPADVRWRSVAQEDPARIQRFAASLPRPAAAMPLNPVPVPEKENDRS